MKRNQYQRPLRHNFKKTLVVSCIFIIFY